MRKPSKPWPVAKWDFRYSASLYNGIHIFGENLKWISTLKEWYTCIISMLYSLDLRLHVYIAIGTLKLLAQIKSDESDFCQYVKTRFLMHEHVFINLPFLTSLSLTFWISKYSISDLVVAHLFREQWRQFLEPITLESKQKR